MKSAFNSPSCHFVDPRAWYGDIPHAPAIFAELAILDGWRDEPGELCRGGIRGFQSYEVEGVNSPQQALGRLADGEYEILFTDVVMPGGMDGVALARQALQMRPGLKVLLTSGYAKTLLEEDNPPAPLLSKPYRKTDLARAFDRLGEDGGGE